MLYHSGEFLVEIVHHDMVSSKFSFAIRLIYLFSWSIYCNYYSVNGNTNILCAKVSCKKKKSRVSAVAISIAGSIVLLLVVIAAWWGLIKRKKNQPGKTMKPTFFNNNCTFLFKKLYFFLGPRRKENMKGINWLILLTMLL